MTDLSGLSRSSSNTSLKNSSETRNHRSRIDMISNRTPRNEPCIDTCDLYKNSSGVTSTQARPIGVSSVRMARH